MRPFWSALIWDQQRFASHYDATRLLTLAGLQQWGPGDRLYRPGYTSDSGEVIEPERMPTVAEWLASITAPAATPVAMAESQLGEIISGIAAVAESSPTSTATANAGIPAVAQLINAFAQPSPPRDLLSRLPGQYVGRGMGQLERLDRNLDTGVDMPVMELRGMAKSVPYEEWAKIAHLVIEVVSLLNYGHGMSMNAQAAAAAAEQQLNQQPRTAVTNTLPARQVEQTYYP